ncbi:hypothetical protein [Thermococcus sp. JCM 11816]
MKVWYRWKGLEKVVYNVFFKKSSEKAFHLDTIEIRNKNVEKFQFTP